MRVWVIMSRLRWVSSQLGQVLKRFEPVLGKTLIKPKCYE